MTCSTKNTTKAENNGYKKMTKFNITTEYSIWCDRCSHWERHTVPSKQKFAKFMKDNCGWEVLYNKTVCRFCVGELTDAGEWNTNIGFRPKL